MMVGRGSDGRSEYHFAYMTEIMVCAEEIHNEDERYRMGGDFKDTMLRLRALNSKSVYSE